MISFEKLQSEAHARLDRWAIENKAKLEAGITSNRVWVEGERSYTSKIARGVVHVYKNSTTRYPGVQYSFDCGANSDHSHSGFLPGVALPEALLLMDEKIQKEFRG